MAKYNLCNYHHDSLGWLECSEGWVSSEFIPELDKGTEYNHCQVDEARNNVERHDKDYNYYS
jgi:hypothetical protein